MEMTPHQVSVAAEAFAACLFAPKLAVMCSYIWRKSAPITILLPMRKSKAVRILRKRV